LFPAAALLVVASELRNAHWAVAAGLPLALGGALLAARAPVFSAAFTASAVEVAEPPQVIPYESLQGLLAKGRAPEPFKKGPAAYPIHVMHDAGVLCIPAHLDVLSDDVYRALYEQFPTGGSRAVNPLLADYLRQNEEAFGPERVWSYTARRHLGARFRSREATAVWAAVVLSGLAWGVIGLSNQANAWLPVGLVTAFIGGLMLGAVRLDARTLNPRVKNWRQSSLAITPVGLSVVQGNDQGELRWDELRGLRLRTGPGLFSSSEPGPRAGIELVLDGASFIIADVYDRPLPVILERIKQYWR
jgi:hypothetical protein